MERGLIPAAGALPEWRDAWVPWKSRARHSEHLSTPALSLSLFPPLLSEKPLPVIMQPLFSYLSSAGKDDSSCLVLSLPAVPSAARVTCPSDRSDISPGHRSCSCIKCQQWGGNRRGERAPRFSLPKAIILSTAVRKVPRGSHFHGGDYFFWIQS